MAKFDAKSGVPIDVVVLGCHPAAHVAALLLRQDAAGAKPAKGGKPRLRIVHVPVDDGQPADRLVVVNPELFDLHPAIAKALQPVPTTAVFGVRFLADDGTTASEYRTPAPVVRTAVHKDLRDALATAAEAAGVEVATGPVSVERVDETGVHLTVGRHALSPAAVVLANGASAADAAVLGVPDGWGPDVVRRFVSVRCKTGRQVTLADAPLMPMSLDLCGQLCWAWLVPGDGEFQLTVEQPAGKAGGRELLVHWLGVLQRHGVLPAKFAVDPAAVTSVDLPLAGALVHEGVASRTLLVGPAGGFLSACGEDVYPGCWSAVYAADVLRKSLKREHLQDALGDYRQVWRTTLGDYLRGPQQNLRLLLPLVYRNPVMTARLAEAILLSKSVVR